MLITIAIVHTYVHDLVIYFVHFMEHLIYLKNIRKHAMIIGIGGGIKNIIHSLSHMIDHHTACGIRFMCCIHQHRWFVMDQRYPFPYITIVFTIYAVSGHDSSARILIASQTPIQCQIL
eukprot:65301_1